MCARVASGMQPILSRWYRSVVEAAHDGERSTDDIAQLTTRVETLEHEVEGEKTVTRYILEQTRRNGDDLAAVKTRLGRVENRLDGVEQKLHRQIDEFAEWRKSLPLEIAEVMREVLREHRS